MIPMQHIDQKPPQDFGLYLRTGRHPAHNKIIDMALADGWIDANPFYAVKYGVERFSKRRFRPKRGQYPVRFRLLRRSAEPSRNRPSGPFYG